MSATAGACARVSPRQSKAASARPEAMLAQCNARFPAMARIRPRQLFDRHPIGDGRASGALTVVSAHLDGIFIRSRETGPRLGFEGEAAGLFERAVARLLYDLGARELHLVRVNWRDSVDTRRPSGTRRIG